MDNPAPQESQQPLCAETKCCTKCGEVKALTEFYIKNKKTGLRNYMCKACCIKREQDRHKNGTAWGCKPENKEKKKSRWRQKYWENPEKFREVALKAFYKRHDAALSLQRQRYHENPEKAIAKSLKWNRDNPEKVKKWANNNRPKIRASVKKYRLLHPETASESRAIRRARKAGVRCERITSGMIDRLFAFQKGKCVYCPADLNVVPFHKDHIIPLARGGEHTESNHQLLCRPCNLRKHAKHPLDFAAEMGIVKDPTLISI